MTCTAMCPTSWRLGAAKNLALGSDFDGADLPDYLNSPAKAAGIYEYLLSRGIGQELARPGSCSATPAAFSRPI